LLKQHNQFFKSLILLSDLCCLTLAWWGAYELRFSFLLFLPPEPYTFGHYVAAWLFALAIWSVVFELLDLYRPRRVSTHWREVVDLFKGSLLALLGFLGLIFLIRDIVLSRLVVVIFWTLSVVLLNFSHVGVREVLRVLRRRGFNLRHILVIGSRPEAQRLVQTLERHRQLGLQIRGILLLDENGKGSPSFGALPVLPNREDALQLIRTGAIDQVFITLTLHESHRLREIRDWIGDEPVTTHFVPDLAADLILHGRVEEFDGLPIITLQASPLYGWNSVLKRGLDFCLGSVAVVLLSPFIAFIALLIRCSGSGPVFFRQERMGLDGRRFEMLKFRTMVEDAERDTGPIWTDRADPRVTATGRWLRRTSLDELPQLWNVLKGEMSLVGPRPERPELIEKFRKEVPKYMLRLKVKAGMTGWAQVHGWRGNTSLERRIEHDIYYIENWSLWLDLKVLALSLMRGFVNKNAY
jgi:Undecaprenyl-phosphate glucose phosphotransferase